MQVLSKKTETANFNPGSNPQKLAVCTNQIKSEDLLKLVDITLAIDYYGVTELLDAIGEDELRSHFNLDHSLGLYSDVR
jgi:hypothetical protein